MHGELGFSLRLQNMRTHKNYCIVYARKLAESSSFTLSFLVKRSEFAYSLRPSCKKRSLFKLECVRVTADSLHNELSSLKREKEKKGKGI